MTTALVTGATAGIGREFAVQLAARGNDLVLVARDVERLEELAAELRRTRGVQVEILPADLSDREATARVAQRLADRERPVDVLVNNAGFGMKQSFLVNDLADEEGMFDVLCRAVLVLSHAAVSKHVGAVFSKLGLGPEEDNRRVKAVLAYLQGAR